MFKVAPGSVPAAAEEFWQYAAAGVSSAAISIKPVARLMGVPSLQMESSRSGSAGAAPLGIGFSGCGGFARGGVVPLGGCEELGVALRDVQEPNSATPKPLAVTEAESIPAFSSIRKLN